MDGQKSLRQPGASRVAPQTNLFKRLIHLLLDGEIFVTGGLVAASLVSERLLPVAVIGAVLFWLLRLVDGRLTRRTPADLGILLLALMLPVTLWATALPEKTIPQVLRLLSGILLFYAMLNWATTRERARWLLNGTLAAGLGLALLAPFSVDWPVGKLPFLPAGLYERFAILLSDSVHPNVLAATLGLFLPLPAALLLFSFKSLRWPERLLAVLTLLAGAGVLALTQSRAGWMSFAAVLAFLALLRGRWGWLLLALGGAAGAFGLYQLGLPRVLDILASSNTIGGVEGRVEIWSRAIYMIQDFSFTGIGMGSFGEVADLLYPFFLASPGAIPHAHNLFLQVGVDLGIPGLIAWLAVLFSIIYSAWLVFRCGREQRDAWLWGAGAGLLGSQLVLILHGMLDAAVWGMVKPAPLVWLLWSLPALLLPLTTPGENVG